MTDRPTTYRTVTGSVNPVANTAIFAFNSITSPGQNIVVVPPPRESTTGRVYTRDAAYDPLKVPGAIAGTSKFNTIFTAVAVIIGIAFVTEVAMTIELSDPLTTLQDRLFSSADWVLKGGLGVFFGLLGGKQIK